MSTFQPQPVLVALSTNDEASNGTVETKKGNFGQGGVKKKTQAFFECRKCGPFVKAFSEIYVIDSDDPFAIEIMEPTEMGFYEKEVIILRPTPEGEKHKLAFCGHCGGFVAHGVFRQWGDETESVRHKGPKSLYQQKNKK